MPPPPRRTVSRGTSLSVSTHPIYEWCGNGADYPSQYPLISNIPTLIRSQPWLRTVQLMWEVVEYADMRMGNVGAIFDAILAHGNISALSLNDSDLSPEHVFEVCALLRYSHTLKTLHLRNCRLYDLDAYAISVAIDSNASLRYLDLSCNEITFDTIRDVIVPACERHRMKHHPRVPLRLVFSVVRRTFPRTVPELVARYAESKDCAYAIVERHQTMAWSNMCAVWERAGRGPSYVGTLGTAACRGAKRRVCVPATHVPLTDVPFDCLAEIVAELNDVDEW